MCFVFNPFGRAGEEHVGEVFSGGLETNLQPVAAAALEADGIPGPAGTMCSCFLQMFYVSFLFPWCMKYLYRAKRANTGTA